MDTQKNPESDKTEWRFEWLWCPTCEIATIKCPKCRNPCCNGMYGLVEGTADAKEKCNVCPLTYQYAELAYGCEMHPSKEQLEKHDHEE